MASTLGTLNPFRYRGYVYDEETGLYYLRSRYYNPEWGKVPKCRSINSWKSILGYVSVASTMGITSAISDWASAYSAKVGKIISYIDNIMGMPVISDLLNELFSMYYYSYEIDQVEEMESILDWKE